MESHAAGQLPPNLLGEAGLSRRVADIMADTCPLLKHGVILMRGTVASHRGEAQVNAQAVSGDQTGTPMGLQEERITSVGFLSQRQKPFGIDCPGPPS